MRYLITGAAGFIGSHLTTHLESQGHTVIGYDIRRGHMTQTGSVLNADLLDSWVSRVDAVFHLASVVGFATVMKDPIRTIETSILGTTNVLRACLHHGKSLLMTSTSAVYGRTTDDQRPVQETDPIRLGPPSVRSWCYAYAKAADECLALAYHQERGVPVAIVRLFNVVGPRQNGAAGFVLPRFIEAAKRNQPLYVHAPGTQTRTLGHVQDIVGGLAQLMDCPEAQGEIVNLGGTETIGMYTLAERVRNYLDSSSAIEIVPDPYGKGYENVAHRKPDLRKAERLIGYRPQRDLDTMIADVAANCEARV